MFVIFFLTILSFKFFFFFFSSRRRHTRFKCDWSSDVCSSDLIRGKGNRVERLPLPQAVGEALAQYLIRTRRAGASRAAFLTVRGRPPRPLTAMAVRQIVARACARAGLPRLGAHRLRHTLASDLLRAGNSLPQIGQVLRHRSQLSTVIYAKVDTARLRDVARPWPGRR